MSSRRPYRLTIHRAMAYVAVAGFLLGVIAANRHQLDVVAIFLLPFLVLVVPAHFAIEANRREVDHPDRECSEVEPDPSRPCSIKKLS